MTDDQNKRIEISYRTIASCVSYTIISMVFVVVFYLLNSLHLPFSDILLLIGLVGSFLSIIQICSSWKTVQSKFRSILALLFVLLTVVPTYAVMYVISAIGG